MSEPPRTFPSPLRGGVRGRGTPRRSLSPHPGPPPQGGRGFAGAVVQRLTSNRLHLSHGPIDVVLKAWGEADAVVAAYRAAVARFPQILPELCAELARLRAPVGDGPSPESRVGRRMLVACHPFLPEFITPMAAVAGAVADELLASMLAAAPLDRAYVNNGGDIAVFCAPGRTLDIGIAGDFRSGPVPMPSGAVRVRQGDGIGGIATSGAQGRSFSLGIADSVTVLAADAAAADAAATIIANAVDLDSPVVERRPACALDPDSDLGQRPVTVAVGPLSAREIEAALAAGLVRARAYRDADLIIDAALTLKGETVTLSAQSAENGWRQSTHFPHGEVLAASAASLEPRAGTFVRQRTILRGGSDSVGSAPEDEERAQVSHFAGEAK
jgi:ApbE superfamily uncharacterized protein (UPF0280 family)